MEDERSDAKACEDVVSETVTADAGTIFLVFESIPDRSEIYLLKGLAEKERAMVLSAHNTIMNTESETEATRFVSKLLLDRLPQATSDDPDAKPFKVRGEVDVVVTGVAL